LVPSKIDNEIAEYEETYPAIMVVTGELAIQYLMLRKLELLRPVGRTVPSSLAVLHPRHSIQGLSEDYAYDKGLIDM